jgi:uncharacterized repeat protein (TIGR01451 family)
MKKFISLTIPVGLMTILFIVVILSARSAAASTLNLVQPGDNGNPEQAGPPWYNEAWHYRREVIVSNGGNSLPYYQVLVKLDESNFEFGRAKVDGSDLRFTHSDGTTELKFWIESWDKSNQLAYVWVRVPSLANGDTVIYVYYNNPTAVAISDGTTTFDFFDDYWCQFPGAGCKLGEGSDPIQRFQDLEKPGDIANLFNFNLPSADLWQILAGSPTASAGILTLPEGTGIRTVNTYQYKAVGFRANYGLGTGKEWAGFINGTSGQRTTIGDRPDHVDDLYLIDHVSEDETVLLPRVGGLNWHEAYHNYEIRWSNGQSMGDVDHGDSTAISTLPGQVPSIFLPVTFYSSVGSNASLLVDYVYIRQYRNPEPSVILGIEQGFIDLAIGKTDSPDPLYAGEILSYQLTISNTSNLDAPGVVVTDTLPALVIADTAEPSQGECSIEDGKVLCSLGSIPKLSTASITIVVTTTMDGEINNLASVGSLGYDENMSNNVSEAATTVIPSADLAVTVQGNPEVLLPGGILVYNITVTNQGPSQAIGISMVNTLPNEVIFIGTSPGTCSRNNLEITCPIENLNQAEEALVVITTTVKIVPTMELLDSATASSNSTHDPDLTNNTGSASNLVDKTPPVINWERPVHKGETYVTLGGMVTLEASATDNDQVNRVEFLLYYHTVEPPELPYWIPLGVKYASPYEVSFYTDMLELNETYQLYAYGYDRVGNWSRERIFIRRIFLNYQYLPLLNKK